MSINIGSILTVPCVNAIPVDNRCDDPAFALANPDLCPVEQTFIIKPGVALICELGSVKFRAFTVDDGMETDVTAQTVFTSSSNDVIIVNPTTGDATGVAAGEATITASYQGLNSQAQVSVLAGENCCDDVTVAMMVVVDQSKSMSQVFGTGYTTKLSFARAAAIALIDSVNEFKDSVGLEKFTEAGATLLASPTSDKDSVSALVPGIAQTQEDTAFYDAMETAIAALNLTGADRKMLVLITDGEDTTASYADYNPLVLADDFRAAGGIVLCLGVRAHGPGYNFLSALSTGGFFVNAYQATSADALDFLIGLKGYVCGGNCLATGDKYIYSGALCYADLLNWDLADESVTLNTALDPIDPDYLTGCVDLLGNGFFDHLPGNGLYLDLVSDTNGSGVYNPLLVSKDKFSLVQDDTYRLSIKIAGNQIVNANSLVRVQVVATGSGEELLNMQVSLPYLSGFQSFGWKFTAPNTEDVKISIWQTTIAGTLTSTGQQAGALLKEVKFEALTTEETLFFDDFSTENATYVGPKCGTGVNYVVVGEDAEPHSFALMTDPAEKPVMVQAELGNGHMYRDDSFIPASGYLYTFTNLFGETYFGDNGVQYNFEYEAPGATNAAQFTFPNNAEAEAVKRRIYRQTQINTDPEHGPFRLVKELDFDDLYWEDLESQASWEARAYDQPLIPIDNTTEGDGYIFAPAYGYAYAFGYGCYGDGCLDTPPPSQLQDPDPLPNLESGTAGGSFTSTQSGCAPACPVGFVDIGFPVASTELATGAEYVTTIQLSEATAIKTWEVTFNRTWSQDGQPLVASLKLEGSNDGSTWDSLGGFANGAVQPTIQGGVAGLTVRFTLVAESDAFVYYRATIGDGNPSDDGKVMELQVYEDPGYPLCRTATAHGATPSQAVANALTAAVNAAKAAQNCVELFTASEIYIADGGDTGAASASSLNSLSEAQQIAGAAAAAQVA